MNPIVNTVSGVDPLEILVKQADVVAPEDRWRVSVERNGAATGTVTVSCRYLGCTQYNKVKEIQLAQLTEPKHCHFAGDVDSIKFSHVSLVGSYNAIVRGE
jgi:hypothetical protein